jgi:hypothetical protein
LICETCGKEFTEDWRKYRTARAGLPRFCSMHCAESRHHSASTRKKISDAMYAYHEKLGTKKEYSYCKKCGKRLSYNNLSGYCSKCILAHKREAYAHCKKCGALLSFNNKTGVCIKCNHKISVRAEHVKEWRRRKKQILVEYKGGRCEICGYNKCLAALEFHHRDNKDKDFGISNKNIADIESYKKEVDKCILLCSNCHREVHDVGLEQVLREHGGAVPSVDVSLTPLGDTL